MNERKQRSRLQLLRELRSNNLTQPQNAFCGGLAFYPTPTTGDTIFEQFPKE